MELTLRAYAKINLGLRVLGKRDDGYHDIETIFHRIDCHDELHLSASSSVTITCSDAALSIDEGNLCVRAASVLRRRFGIGDGVHIALTKRIPVGAGLGGGSADAAAILIGLVRLWELSVSREELAAIALSLGSDVPYFLRPGSAYARGRGDILEYFTLDLPYWIVTAFPGVPIPTEWAYRNVVPRARKGEASLKELLLRHRDTAGNLDDCLPNDFESVVLRSYEIVGNLMREFRENGAEFIRMSGSGSSVFAFFREENPAREAYERIGRRARISITAPHFQPPGV